MSSLTKGTILENAYEIIDEIGAGGGGIIYKARHLRLQTDVVVKKIKDEVRGKIRSRQEADILKKLKHPYLPRVYDFIETEDGVYTVMDFIHGAHGQGNIKIDQADISRLRQHDIRRFDITVDNWRRLCMQIRQCLS